MSKDSLPLVLAGPILRRTTSDRITFWMATSKPVAIELSLHPEGESAVHLSTEQMESHLQRVSASEHLYFYLLDIQLEQALPLNSWIGYDFQLTPKGAQQSQGFELWAPDICYPERSLPGFVIAPKVRTLLHGSCRKPHHDSKDGLLAADQHLADTPVAEWPSLLMLSGDQVYADDVATPMLVAIHQVIAQLDLPVESFDDADWLNSDDLHGERAYYLRRQELLPALKAGGAVEVLFSGARKPIFTSDHAQNHLVSVGEVLAMYLLVWSPALWQAEQTQPLLGLVPPPGLTEKQLQEYHYQLEVMGEFAQGLGSVRRLLAHIPTAMVFDDHDVTDDWNLSAAWEQSAYGHPFSKRIIGNALCGYLLCQAWGNAPEHFDSELIDKLNTALQNPGDTTHQALIEQLLSFDQWHYQWDTQPCLLVLDTRTHRWRSERHLASPSGLMDWEALTDLQQSLIGKDAVLMVSPAPIFGVKVIEIIQRIFTWLGKPLVVDAENWMAHSGAAKTLLNMFCHGKTPQNFVILSGDVHYSFAYQVSLRHRKGGPDIWQITSSGIKNTFPKRLLDVLDRVNRWLYAPYSPLNWFNKRRRMKIVPHKPMGASPGERLLNGSGIGLVELDESGAPKGVWQVLSDGQMVRFDRHQAEEHWD
ncbi:alkaline phosphatase D family protein [Paraferrimonas sedimenticola]|uniref:PhoD-like phosphatase n=1 Tax=Paraferrimonas sedimenticola TaxID=375674 RepID=A0AA37RVP7_9GAMM|nr:alkaline phosphatase D family protein [Paraferrimonas sedimenticola]GLP95482.1 hypothetical protein GCM10007895_07880 [Paraferrimonas sedimenticola]